MSKKVDDYNKEIEKANKDYLEYDAKSQAELQSIRARLETISKEMDKKRKDHDDMVIKLQQERDALALDEKLKSFPKHLVEGHKFCSVCNGAMRPFQIVESGETVKYWGCQSGNLKIDHDLVKV